MGFAHSKYSDVIVVRALMNGMLCSSKYYLFQTQVAHFRISLQPYF
jgi:hypothetical protein